jgi:hypothetical protein
MADCYNVLVFLASLPYVRYKGIEKAVVHRVKILDWLYVVVPVVEI